MSTNVILIVVGVLLFLAGLAKLGISQSGQFNVTNILKNTGLNIGGTQTQVNVGQTKTPEAAKETKPDWVGLAIAAIGLLTALLGCLKG
jgi:hypothetical protein